MKMHMTTCALVVAGLLAMSGAATAQAESFATGALSDEITSSTTGLTYSWDAHVNVRQSATGIAGDVTITLEGARALLLGPLGTYHGTVTCGTIMPDPNGGGTANIEARLDQPTTWLGTPVDSVQVQLGDRGPGTSTDSTDVDTVATRFFQSGIVPPCSVVSTHAEYDPETLQGNIVIG
jgi:hypothetical protein